MRPENALVSLAQRAHGAAFCHDAPLPATPAQSCPKHRQQDKERPKREPEPAAGLHETWADGQPRGCQLRGQVWAFLGHHQ